jgi:hypothetical protein
MLKKINKYNEIYKIHGFKGLLREILIKLKLREKFDPTIKEKKIELEYKIRQLSKNFIINGNYSRTYLSGKSSWQLFDNCSKYLGLYEEQIQDKIILEQKKNNLKFLVNFGASDGYHILGLLKNSFFEKGLAFEINATEKINLEYNIKKNNLESKIKTFSKANFEDVLENIEPENLKKTLFLIDIEGNEFELFDKKILKILSNSFFIIENHDFMIENKKIIEKFWFNIKNFFNYELIYQSSRNPFSIDFLKQFSEDEKWIMMSEMRPQNMNWIFLKPKII